MGHAVLQPLRVGLSRVPHIWIRVFLRDQPYGVVIKPLIRGNVDAVRQHCPAKRLTPMGLSAGENARGFYDYRRNIGHIPLRVYVAVWGKYRQSKPLGLVFW